MINPLSKDIYLERSAKRTEDIRGAFFRDQTAIIHSMPFRRLKHKTQVFYSPMNDHVCTRIEHVLHVATIATTICKGLLKMGWEVSEEMAFAIGLSHDLGHAPFGHAGESILNEILKPNDTFIHEVNSLRVAEVLTNNGRGLNLTYGVKDGIICHNGEKFEQYLIPKNTVNILANIRDRKCLPTSYEGCITRFADKIAYLGRDIEDAIKAKFIKQTDIPPEVRKALGSKNGEIINTLVIDIIKNSAKTSKIGFSDGKYEVINKLYNFNNKYIYGHPRIKTYKKYCESIIRNLFKHLSEIYSNYGQNYREYQTSSYKLDQVFGKYLEKMKGVYDQEGNIPNKIIMDYISGMTDDYALEAIKDITIPDPIEF